MGGDQSYAERTARRPAYKRYKNRKKTIRKRHQAGLITDHERQILLERAYRIYRSDPSTVAGSEDGRERLRGHLYWQKAKHQPAEWYTAMKARSLEYRGGSFCGDDSCAGAPPWGPCNCRCGGMFHGASRNSTTMAISDAEVDAAIEAARTKAEWTPAERVCGEAGCARYLSPAALAARERRCVEHRRLEGDDLPRCGLCGRPQGGLTGFEGLRLCRSCIAEVETDPKAHYEPAAARPAAPGPPVYTGADYHGGGERCGTLDGYTGGCRCRYCKVAERQARDA